MLPEQFLDRMKEMLGEEFPAFLESYEKDRYQALRLNGLKKSESGENALDILSALFHLEKVEWAENGYYYQKEDQPGKHPFHEAGVYYIQEPSAMAPVEQLQVMPGERVLDLCASPGGKSTQIASKLQGEGWLLCNEIHPVRAKNLSENIERMGIWNACVTNETPEKLASVFPVYFDKILVDAPCSGEGMFRKNEDAVFEWSLENVANCAAKQAEILDCAAQMLKPGGRLVYSTCTFSPQENEESISKFLERHPEFSLEKQKRLYPHQIKGEGHFLAVLNKSGERVEEYVAATGLSAGLSKKDIGVWTEFEKDTLKQPVQEIFAPSKFLAFGENLYLVPEFLPGLKGLKVLRPGLHLGTEKKNRFEPAHALALALSGKEVRYSCALKQEERLVADYLNGMTFPMEGEKGWYIISVNGFSLGWGKLAGNIMKNHYPKGLRKP